MKEFDVLKKHEFKFNKKYGQNFIFDKNLLKAIVSDAEINADTNVLEIGCGSGSLTAELAKSANFVLGYEIDENLKPILNENLQGFNNVEINFKDILKCEINEIESKFKGEYVLVANLPYYITTPIIFKFLEEATKLKRLVVMVQYEVAKRLCALQNTPDYGAITVALNYRADCMITRVVKRNMFTPQPNVDSAIVKVEFKNKYKIHSTDILNKLIKTAFAMRRKTLANNLKASFGFTNAQIERVLTKANLPCNIRGEALSVEEFVNLSNIIFLNK